MTTGTLAVGTLALTLPAAAVISLAPLHENAKAAAADMAKAESDVRKAEGDMAATLHGLHRIARGDLKAAVTVKDPILVAQWFGMSDMAKEAASEWIAASVAVVDWHAPAAVIASGRKALVEWARSAEAAAKAKADALAAEGLPDAMAKVAARGEVRARLVDADVVDAGNGAVTAARTVAAAVPGVEALEGKGGRIAKAEGARKQRAAGKAPVGEADATPAPKGRVDHVTAMADGAKGVRDVDMAEGRGCADWRTPALAIRTVVGDSEAWSLALALLPDAAAKAAKAALAKAAQA